MPMFTTIVSATDGSPQAEHALALASGLARQEHAPLHVVHVVEKLVGGRATGMNSRIDQEDLSEQVQATVKRMADDGLQVTAHFPQARAGNAAVRIADVARDVGADLIVVGTRGHSGLAGVVLGSATQRLLHVAPCPVLAVPAAPTADPESELAAGT